MIGRCVDRETDVTVKKEKTYEKELHAMTEGILFSVYHASRIQAAPCSKGARIRL